MDAGLLGLTMSLQAICGRPEKFQVLVGRIRRWRVGWRTRRGANEAMSWARKSIWVGGARGASGARRAWAERPARAERLRVEPGVSGTVAGRVRASPGASHR